MRWTNLPLEVKTDYNHVITHHYSLPSYNLHTLKPRHLLNGELHIFLLTIAEARQGLSRADTSEQVQIV